MKSLLNELTGAGKTATSFASCNTMICMLSCCLCKIVTPDKVTEPSSDSVPREAKMDTLRMSVCHCRYLGTETKAYLKSLSLS